MPMLERRRYTFVGENHLLHELDVHSDGLMMCVQQLALYRHRRRRVYCVGIGVPVLELTRLGESFPAVTYWLQ